MGRLVISVTLCIALSSIDLPLCSSSEAHPVWKTFPKNLNATVGDDASLSCALLGLEKDGPTRWEHRRNGKTNYQIVIRGNTSYDPCCEISGDISQGEYNLLIRNVTAEDAGEWRCVHLQARPKTKKATLTVRLADDNEGTSREERTGESRGLATASPSYSVIVAAAVAVLTVFGFPIF
ncbi:signal-regulatory protein beta-2-like isoform X4 [Ptychodera flava]|uniref:signal-regulatory protein beta-2-like isoform X4 n=1 Tax=Ptychodera flava TaxID=63121 RepID=UPI003969DFC0